MKRTKSQKFEILYKNVSPFAIGKAEDLTLYSATVEAKSEKDALEKFERSRTYTVQVQDKRFRKSFKTRPVSQVKGYRIVRITSGDPTMFVNYRGKFERRYIRTAKSRMPFEVKHSFGR